ncbi:hypothetical protein STAQ_42580 [Allostella sp. ATCC 35155]|nr:hypothetical protein STAQ_42580 [Stella sp. ATCC 35155]
MDGPIPYCGPGPRPGEAWASWNLDPVLLAGLALLLTAGMGRAALRGGGREGAAFAAGWAMLAILFVSPICAMASALFSVRVAHHLLLIAVAAPLLAAALPLARTGRLGLPLATLVQTVVVWVWHAPAPYDAALGSYAIYWLMQATLLGSAVAFWMSLRSVGAASAAGASALLATIVQMGLLGAIITFAPRPLYRYHLATTPPWGLTPIEDQQLAGLLMWVPGAAPYAAVALVALAGWLARARRDRAA